MQKSKENKFDSYLNENYANGITVCKRLSTLIMLLMTWMILDDYFNANIDTATFKK